MFWILTLIHILITLISLTCHMGLFLCVWSAINLFVCFWLLESIYLILPSVFILAQQPSTCSKDMISQIIFLDGFRWSLCFVKNSHYNFPISYADNYFKIMGTKSNYKISKSSLKITFLNKILFWKYVFIGKHIYHKLRYNSGHISSSNGAAVAHSQFSLLWPCLTFKGWTFLQNTETLNF